MIRIRPLLLVSAAVLAASIPGGLRAAQGDLVWEDVVNLGFFRTDGSIAGIENGRVYAVINGNVTDSPSSNARVITRGYDALAGTILWTDEWQVSPFDDSARGAVTSDVVLVAASTVLNSTEAIATYSVRAYDGASGTVLWSDQCGPGLRDANGARNVLALAGRFFVAGVCEGSGFLRAYDAGTGAVAWEAATFPFPYRGGNAPVLAALDGRVFLLDMAPAGEPFVRALDAATGQDLWVTGFLPATGTSDILAAGQVVAVAVGSVVRALDAATGQTLWEVDFGDVVEFPDLVRLTANRLALTVRFSFTTDSVARVYDARSGRLVSEGPGSSLLPGIVEGKLRYVAGSRIPLQPPMGMREFFLQAFEGKRTSQPRGQANRGGSPHPANLPE